MAGEIISILLVKIVSFSHIHPKVLDINPRIVTVNAQSDVPSKPFCAGSKNFPRIKFGE